MKIFADSACDLPSTSMKRKMSPLMPLHVLIVVLSMKILLKLILKKRTKQFVMEDILKLLKSLPNYSRNILKNLQLQEQAGIYIAFSSELSGTYATSVMIRNQLAEQHPSLDLVIIDSKCASLGCGLLPLKKRLNFVQLGNHLHLSKKKFASWQNIWNTFSQLTTSITWHAEDVFLRKCIYRRVVEHKATSPR